MILLVISLMQDKASGEVVDFSWDKVPDNFKCVDSITVVIGGTTNDNKYIDDVEIIAPTMKCHHEQLPRFPIKVIRHFENLIHYQYEYHVPDIGKGSTEKNIKSVSTVSYTGLCSTSDEKVTIIIILTI